MSGMFIEVNMKAIFVVISCSENKAWKKKKKKKKRPVRNLKPRPLRYRCSAHGNHSQTIREPRDFSISKTFEVNII